MRTKSNRLQDLYNPIGYKPSFTNKNNISRENQRKKYIYILGWQISYSLFLKFFKRVFFNEN